MQFKDILGYENRYSIDRNGNVFSHKLNRLLKPKIDKDGYKSVALTVDGTTKHLRVHRLVAITYIPNPNNYTIVNHINEIKDDNRVENLEWCTVKYNNNYGSRNLKMSKSKQLKPVLQLSLTGEVVARFNGVKEAMTLTGINRNCIREVIRGNRKSAGGYAWKYEEVSK